jgi:serine protease Do
LADSAFFPNKSKRRGPGPGTIGALALFFTLVGILIASNFDFSPRSEAQMPVNVSQTGMFPVVETNGELESPFVGVVERVSAAVVNISARTRGEDRPWWFRHGSGTSLGSGFFFRKDGYILTNNHVVDGAVELTVRTASGYEYQAEMIGGDRATDLAVIKVKPEEEVTVIPFGNSEDIKVGDWAIAIGNPFPQQGLDRTVTVGVVSAKGRSNLQFGSDTPQYQDYIQTDASINPGNSGGPLLSLRGEVIGVNAAISSPTGSSVGIGFAIPIDIAKAIVPDLIRTGTVSRGWLGVYLSEVTEREAKRQGLPAVQGVHIDSVFDGSPAKEAGIRKGDVVVAFNDQEVTNGSQFSVLVSTVHPGMEIPIKVYRDGREMEFITKIADREASLASRRTGESDLSAGLGRWLGMELVTYTKGLAAEIGARFTEGVYVTRVYPGSTADRASISDGTVILEVNNEPVSSVDDVIRIADQIGNSRKSIPLMVQEPDGTIARKICRL